MSDLSQTGESLNQIFGPQTEEFFDAVLEAANRLHTLQEGLQIATEGADNGYLRDAMGNFEEMDLALRGIVENISTVRHSGRGLMELLGLEADFGTAEHEVGPSGQIKPRNLAAEAWKPGAPLPLRVNLKARVLWRKGSDRCLENAVVAAEEAGVATVRDMLVIGKARLRAAVPNLGGKGIESLEERMRRYCPDVPFSVRPDPAIAARLCSTLDDVPLTVLYNSDYLQLRPGVKGVTVGDILEYPPIEAHFCASTLSPEMPLRDWHRQKFRDLREEARQYSSKFYDAKEAAERRS